MQNDAAMSGFAGRGFDGAARQHGDQMCAVFGAAVQVAVEACRGHRQTIEHLGREALLQGVLERGDAEYAIRARAISTQMTTPAAAVAAAADLLEKTAHRAV